MPSQPEWLYHSDLQVHYTQSIKFISTKNKWGLQKRETAMWEGKTRHVYCFDRKKCFELGPEESIEGFFQRGRQRTITHTRGILLGTNLWRGLLLLLLFFFLHPSSSTNGRGWGRRGLAVFPAAVGLVQHQVRWQNRTSTQPTAATAGLVLHHLLLCLVRCVVCCLVCCVIFWMVSSVVFCMICCVSF